MRSRDNIFVVIAIIFISLAVCAGGLFSIFRIREIIEESSASVIQLQNELNMRTRSGYVAVADIKAGEVITDSLVQYSNKIISDVDARLFITADDIGKVSVMSITAGTPILTDMVSAKLTENYRERECAFIWLNTNLQNHDFVDVRIVFPNGEDYVICAKKSIKNVNVAANNVFLWLTEDEIQLLDSAIVDASLHEAKIYVTRYLKPEVQEASTVTYSPNSSVLAVIRNNPNIVNESASNLSSEARLAMEKRVGLFEDAYGVIRREDDEWTLPYENYEFKDVIGENDRFDPNAATGDDTSSTDTAATQPTEEASGETAGESTNEGEVTYVD